METEDTLNTRILNITLRIQEHYPELYRNLNEMYATLPVTEIPVINRMVLEKWYESLRVLVANYDTARNT